MLLISQRKCRHAALERERPKKGSMRFVSDAIAQGLCKSLLVQATKASDREKKRRQRYFGTKLEHQQKMFTFN